MDPVDSELDALLLALLSGQQTRQASQDPNTPPRYNARRDMTEPVVHQELQCPRLDIILVSREPLRTYCRRSALRPHHIAQK